MTYELYFRRRDGVCELLGTYRSLEAAVVATGAIGLKLYNINDTQWCGYTGAIDYIIKQLGKKT